MRNEVGIYQLENGNWAFRLVYTKDGKKTNYRRKTDSNGNALTSKRKAIRARDSLFLKLKSEEQKQPIQRRTFGEVFDEYCKYGRNDKAYSTKRKQDSLWNNHLKEPFSDRYVDDISVAEVNDYLSHLYAVDGKSYSYVESFLKMFYLILGQAYSRNYLDVDSYNKLCVNKNTRIKMPKRRSNDDDDIVIFSKEEIAIMDEYFKETTLNTAYLIGKYCGVRINECFGIKWSDVDLDKGVININQQMLYENSVIKLVPLKTHNARRTIVMAAPLQQYLSQLKAEIIIAKETLSEVREQRQIIIRDVNGEMISSLDLINTFPFLTLWQKRMTMMILMNSGH